MEFLPGEADGRDQENLIIFDWDDTILPTSWLERVHALDAGGVAAARPEIQRQLITLVTACQQTLALAHTLGKVIIITNSAPGWVDQSCRLFMPQLGEQVNRLPIYAKPMHAPITFKVGSFKRECKAYRNIVSVGDGDAERDASMRLQAPAERKAAFQAGGRPGSGEAKVPAKVVKSVKLIELPTCMQLIVQHEMLQERLADIAAFQGNLDLKARFMAALNMNGLGLSPPPAGSGLAAAKASCCTLVHVGRAPLDQRNAVAALGNSNRAPQAPQLFGVPQESAKAQGPAAAAAAANRLPSSPVRPAGLGGLGGQLPPLSRTPSLPGGAIGGRAEETDATPAADSSPGRPPSRAGNGPLRGASASNGDGAGRADVEGGAGDQASEKASADGKTPSQETAPTIRAATNGDGAGSGSPIANLGMWKVQPGPDARTGRSPYHAGKKRPVMVPTMKGQSVGVWRENSSPAAFRGAGAGAGGSPKPGERTLLAACH